MKEEIRSYKKTFRGKVTKIVKPVATIKFEKTIYHPKFERFSKNTINIKARISKEFLDKIKVGDEATIVECRPLSKTIHHIVKQVKNNEIKEIIKEKKKRTRKKTN